MWSLKILGKKEALACNLALIKMVTNRWPAQKDTQAQNCKVFNLLIYIINMVPHTDSNRGPTDYKTFTSRGGLSLTAAAGFNNFTTIPVSQAALRQQNQNVRL